jgi:2-polyprenyl-3-methyl-5-hydroxy-6-metoxy-1,4-benzoquinol methylase
MSLFSNLSYISRKRKIDLFHKTFQLNEKTKILEIGSEINFNGIRGLQLIDTYQWKKNITASNISPEHINNIKKHYPEINAVVADASALPWPDKSFDIVFSNAVIEHMGDYAVQKKVAQEIMRVGKSWFITTPNRWFPYEFHMRLPFVTWAPGTLYRQIGTILSYNHDLHKYTQGIRYDDLRLMTRRELKKCFPGSKVMKQRVTFMPETILVVGGID